MMGARRNHTGDVDSIRPRTVIVGGGLLVVGAVLLWVAFSAPRGLPLRHYKIVRAQFANLANLPPQGADVRIAGRRVGQTLNARLSRGIATVDLQLDGATTTLRSDASARVRPRGLLGQQYVDLDPGTSAAPLRSATIDVDHTSASVQLPQVLAALDWRTRRTTAAAIDALGDGMASRGAGLNAMLQQGPAMLAGFDTASQAIISDPTTPTRFVRAAAALSAAMEPVRSDAAAGLDPEARALQPFATERIAVRRTLAIAPAALSAVTAGLHDAGPLLAATRDFGNATTAFTASAPAALRATTSLLRHAGAPLRSLRPLLNDVRPTVPVLLGLTHAAEPVLPRLRATTDAAVQPVGALAPRRCDVLRFARNWHSWLGNGADGGSFGPLNVVRFELIGGVGSIAGAGPQDTKIGRDPFPAPCTDPANPAQ